MAKIEADIAEIKALLIGKIDIAQAGVIEKRINSTEEPLNSRACINDIKSIKQPA